MTKICEAIGCKTEIEEDGARRPFPDDDDYWRRVDEARERAKDEPAETDTDE